MNVALKYTMISLAYALAGRNADAQLFKQVGPGLSNSAVYRFYTDTVGDQLYVGGSFFRTLDSVNTSPGIMRWDGTSFHPVGCGFDWDCVTPLGDGGTWPVRTMTIWNGELYAGGEFQQANGVQLHFIAHFDGTTWQPMGGGMDGPVRSLRVLNDTLYAAGWFNWSDTVRTNGLARWDGAQWHRVHNIPDFSMFSSTNEINDVAMLNGTMYIGGNFNGDGGNGLNCIAQFDGTSWMPLVNGFLGSNATVNRMEAHDSLLYVAGSFADYPPNGNPNNPGSGIIAWDGTNWIELDGGTDGSFNPAVADMAWKHDTLYVEGLFGIIGNISAGRLARWDGHKWCGLLPPQALNATPLCVGFYRDTLYLGGSFTTIVNDMVNRIGKWVVGDSALVCGSPMGIEGSVSTSNELVVYPNPARTGITINYSGYNAHTFDIIDILGRSVGSGAYMRNASIDVSALASGTYTLRLFDARGVPVAVGRFVKE